MELIIRARQIKFVKNFQNHPESSKKNTKKRIEKTRETVKKRYGAEHYSQTNDFKEKYRQTSLKRYGVDHVLLSDDVRQKQKRTLSERYGVSNPSHIQDSLEKRRNTNLTRYGHSCSAQSPKIKEKIINDLKESYGVESWFQVPEVIEKITYSRQLNKYGKPIEEFRDEWRKVYFEKGINAALIAFPMIKVKTAVDTFLEPDERKCADGRSHLEKDVLEFFKGYGFKFEQNVRSIIPGHNHWKIDLVDWENRISIEVNGVYWHQIFEDKTSQDIEKAFLMRNLGFKHLSIDESDLKNFPCLPIL